MEYMIVANSGDLEYRGETADEFEEWINEYILNGWEPVGGVSCNFLGEKVVFYQAMIKRPNKGLEPTRQVRWKRK